MLRRLWAGPRGSATTTKFSSRFWRPQQTNRSFFTPPPTRTQQGPRTRQSRQSQSRILHASHAGIYGSICMSVAMLVTDTTLDFRERQALALKTVYDIVNERDEATKLKRYWDTGLWLLGIYSGAEIEHHGPLRPVKNSGWTEDELETRLMTTPDPDFDGTFVFCQALLFDDYRDTDVYVAQNGNRVTDATEALLPTFEAFAKECRGPVRGVILLVQPDGDWKSVYYDGKRWINIVYLEWQTPASLGYET
ncbi:hypothetical protein F5Y04DRAFT_257453 [Hypomontagnella monticulosa]|nr:hypothetical protein F5Y04DRAFT_257453 [Hypomontagnella monticulosa]